MKRLCDVNAGNHRASEVQKTQSYQTTMQKQRKMASTSSIKIQVFTANVAILRLMAPSTICRCAIAAGFPKIINKQRTNSNQQLMYNAAHTLQ